MRIHKFSCAMFIGPKKSILRSRALYSPKRLHMVRSLYILFLLIPACVDVEGPAPIALSPGDILAEVRFPTRAVMMEMDDSLTLLPQVVAMNGTSLVVEPRQIIWKSEDSIRVYVDTLGKLTARIADDIPVKIIASYWRFGITKADTIPVYVTPTRIDATEIRLLPIDSSRVGSGIGFGKPRVRADLYKDGEVVVSGASIPMTVPLPVVLIYSREGGPDKEPVYLVNNDKGYLGEFWVKASVNLYGTEVVDSVLFNGIFPAGNLGITILPGNDGGITAIEMAPDAIVRSFQPCGWVSVIVSIADPIDVVFSDSAADGDVCAPIPEEVLIQGAGFPVKRSIVGGNMLNIGHDSSVGFLPFTQFLRRSNTVGSITYYVRHAVTKKRLPVSGRFNQAIPE